jgi:hypothetical protein
MYQKKFGTNRERYPLIDLVLDGHSASDIRPPLLDIVNKPATYLRLVSLHRAQVKRLSIDLRLGMGV